METSIISLTLEQRVELLENLVQELSTKKAKSRNVKQLTEAEKEVRRLKLNEASRVSKLKSRALAMGMTIEEYQNYLLTKRNISIAEVADQVERQEEIPGDVNIEEKDAIEKTEETPKVQIKKSSKKGKGEVVEQQ